MARLVKSRNRWIDGVVGGVADYFSISADLLRVILLIGVLVLQMHFLITVYIILMILMPAAGHVSRHDEETADEEEAEAVETHTAGAEVERPVREHKVTLDSGRTMQIFGILLIIAGAVYLIQNQFPSVWHELQFFWDDVRHILEEMRAALLGIALILGGLWLLYKNKKFSKRFR